MTQAITLTRVGNSRAVIIPAKILKSLEITENTILTLSDDNERITISKSGAVRPEAICPSPPAISRRRVSKLWQTVSS